MKMKKWIFGILMVMVAFSSCTKPEGFEEELVSNANDILLASAVDLKGYIATVPAVVKGIDDVCNSKTFALIGGQTIDVGNVVVSNDDEYLYVTYNTTGGWELVEVQLFVLDTEPTERLSPGQAPNKSGTLESGTTTYTFTIPLEGDMCDMNLWLQAHASVVKRGEEGQTAYGGEIVIPETGSWYGNIAYTVVCCDPECEISADAVVTDVKCYGASTGSIDLTVLNGIAPLSFLWSNGATTEDLADVPAGDYSVTVTDAHQCVAVVNNIHVLQPASGINATAQTTNISAFGANDGSIDLTVTGGVGPYTYLWTGPNGFSSASEDISGLAPGTYSVIVTDMNECTDTAEGTLYEGEKPKVIVAFARKTYLPMVYCFSGLDLDGTEGPDFPNDRGWTNGPIPLDNFTSHYELLIRISDCGGSGAVKVGDMAVVAKSDGTGEVVINMTGGYTLNETRLYFGSEKLPKDGSNNFTTDPAFYTYSHVNLNGASGDTYSVTGLTGNIYVIGYASINLPDAN